MKKGGEQGQFSANYTKSYFSTIKNPLNCTKYHSDFRGKIMENLLHGDFFCDILM